MKCSTKFSLCMHKAVHVCFIPQKKVETMTHGQGAQGAHLHPKFLHCFCIYTHPCNLSTHTGGLTSFHPSLDTTHHPNSRGHATKHGLRVPNPKSRGHTTKHGLRVPNPKSRGHATNRGFRDSPGFLNNTGRLGPKRGRKCYATHAFSGVPNQWDKIRSQNLR